MSDDIKVPNIEHTTYIQVLPSRVFETLTTAQGWDGWFTQGTSVNPKSGGEIRLRWKNFGAGHWTMEDGGPVIEVIPNRKFSFEWSPAGHPTTVTFTLKPEGRGTFVTLVETGYSLSEKDIETLVGCSVGWGEALTLLKFYLEHGVTYGKIP